MTSVVFVRTVVSTFVCALLVAAQAACSGDPGSSGTLIDSAGEGHGSTSGAGPSAAGTSSATNGAPSGEPTDCTAGAVAEGCHCADEGQVVACQGQRLDFGDYVTCAGVRECVRGAWGPCITNHFVVR